MQPSRPDAVMLQGLCDQGRALHQAGRLEDAWRCYDQVLAADPDHCDALHLSGVLCIQIGRPEQAVDVIERAIAVQPDVAIAYGNLGHALNTLGRFEEAVRRSDQAVALQPDYAEAHGNRGQALYRLGRVAEALESYQRVVALRGDARSFFNQGVMLHELGRAEEAVASFDQAMARKPDYAEAHHSRGVALRELGEPAASLAALDQAIALRPDRAETHYDRGLALRDLGRSPEALDSYDRALTLRPAYPEAFSNRGNTLTDLKRYEEALDSYAQALALKPDYAEALSNQMLALRALRQPEEALASCDRALALRPDYAEGHNNRGGALYEFQRLEEALESYDKAVALKPDYVEAHTNRAVLLQQLRRLPEAMASYDLALALRPDDAEANFNQAMCRLTLGDYARGWPQYEARWRSKQFEHGVRPFDAPLWLGGEDIRGKTILLHAEQGLGDALQFCRYAPQVAERGARVVLEVYPPLQRLMQRLAGVDQVVPRGAPLPAHDWHAPLMSLPLALGRTPEADAEPYLSADPADVARWAKRLAGEGGLKVGLCWAGGVRPDQPIANAIDKRRSLSLKACAPLANLDGVRLYSLQKGAPAAELAEMAGDWPGPPIVDWTDELGDFADTAALAANLDLVIACDTSTAHLAGGLGKPLWLLNRFDACWRWLDGRDDSPWYPSARLFTQTSAGDWDGVIARVRSELSALALR